MDTEKTDQKNKVYLSLGTNLGDKVTNLEQAYLAINHHLGPILKQSGIYKTPPWGFISDADFFNTVICINTVLSPLDLLERIKALELELGRAAKTKDEYEDRLIDIDIIDYGGERIETTKLTLPHPRMHLRNFVVFPLHEIEPEWRHPKTGESISFWLKNVPNQPPIEKIS